MNNIKTLFKYEILISVMQAFILLYCYALQFLPWIQRYFPVLQSLPCVGKNTAGLFLQLDATILTLTIALLALISSFVTDTYMGISYCDYYLNKRPILYKQSVIISLSFVYLGFAVLLFLLGWYYFVPGILFCEILLIMFSSLSLYNIFRGSHYIRKEIAVFSRDMQLCKSTNKLFL